MIQENNTPGRLMATESAQSMDVFARAATQAVTVDLEVPK